MLSTLLVTGIRRSELLALALDAVDLDVGMITIRRTVLDVDNAPLLRDVTKTNAPRARFQFRPRWSRC